MYSPRNNVIIILSLATDITDVTLGGSDLWLGNRTGATGTVASVTLVANDKGDNEMILEVVHRSPGICLTVEKIRKPQLEHRLMKELCNQSSSQMGSISSK